VSAFDVSDETVADARARNTLRNLTFEHGSALQLPVEANSVDVYISFETIEHLDDDVGFLREVRRVLKPGGLFLCSTPNRVVTNPGASISERPWNRFHVREYSEKEFSELLLPTFSLVGLYGQNPKRTWLADSMGRLAGVLPRHGAVRINQLLKLPLFFADSPRRHAVVEMSPGYTYEYLVAVCRAKDGAE